MNEQQRGLSERAAANEARARTLAQNVADMAGKIAKTEDELARVHEAIAHTKISSIAEVAAERAAKERDVAEHERQEQQRWSAVAAPGEQPPANGPG